MFKTIFSKLIAIFFAVLLISFSITGAILYYFLGDFVSKERVRILEQSSAKISEAFKFFWDNYDNPLIRFSFEQYLESYSSYTQSIVWIVYEDGHVIFSKPDFPESVKRKLADESGYVKLPDERQYKKIMTGLDTYTKIVGGDFYGFFKDKAYEKAGLSWLTVAKSIRYKNSFDQREFAVAVYLHTPLPEVQKVRTSVFKIFILAVSVSILFSATLVYIFSLRITRPLKQIGNAARIIAGGEFQKRLDIKSKDEIGQLAASFNQMAFELQHLEEMRRGFIANVSHELRTPMTSIRGFIEGILDGTIPPEKQKDYLVIVRDETDRLNRLVNDLLDLARMQSGEARLNYKDFDVNELIRRCIIKLENQIVEKNLVVEANFEEEGMLVHADPDAIERVIINLIHNAVKFTNNNGRITISSQSQKDKVLVSVKDNGIGIDKDEINMIWERFYKSDKSRSKDKSGTGLGLAIIKSIINEHNQNIWVESELGKGSEFTFTLSRAHDKST